ncbi:MAG: hypothetical protein IPL78_03620 [Chloroflexi bacterium]|nr:hypothetical protein [Chloroflexota bacterium]
MGDDSSFEDENEQDRIQRILNEKKKRELEEQYGMIFSDEEMELPPEVEGEWLDYVAEFERQFEDAEQITIREFIGNPVIKPLADIAEDDLEAELEQLFELLIENGIHLDFLTDVDETEMYRFIAEEFLDEEMDNIRIEGMMHGFIYEDFHPSDEYDSKFWAEHFLQGLFTWNQEMMEEVIDADVLYDAAAQPATLADFRQMVEAFYAQNPIILAFTQDALSSQVEGDEAWVQMTLSWERLPPDLGQGITIERQVRLRMKRSPFGGWDVIQVNWPDLMDKGAALNPVKRSA